MNYVEVLYTPPRTSKSPGESPTASRGSVVKPRLGWAPRKFRGLVQLETTNPMRLFLLLSSVCAWDPTFHIYGLLFAYLGLLPSCPVLPMAAAMPKHPPNTNPPSLPLPPCSQPASHPTTLPNQPASLPAALHGTSKGEACLLAVWCVGPVETCHPRVRCCVTQELQKPRRTENKVES